MSTEILVLNREEVEQCLSMAEAIELMQQAFARLSSGEAKAPVRTHLPIGDYKNIALFMPVVDEQLGYFALKTVSVFPTNKAYQMPLINGSIMLYDAHTGVPLAVMDAEYITALRTGAASGLATALLARPDSSICGIFGAGTQAETQLEAVTTVRPIREALIFSRDPESARSFSKRMKKRLDIDIRPATGMEELKTCDIVCTATTATNSVFNDQDLQRQVHINAVGTFQPNTTEIPMETVMRSWLIVDQREACMKEAGEIAMLLKTARIKSDHIRAEIGEIANGKVDPPEDWPECSLFKSVGNAVQDLYTTAAVYKIASNQNLGKIVKL
ncbi:MAG: ornithine cyclodeaminase family protein [Calditrichia bacterium]